MLGDRPAVLAVQPRDHAQHQSSGMPQRLVTSEPRRDPVDHRAKLRPPPIRVYAMSRGGRGNFRCVHKLRTMPRSPPLSAQTRQTTKVTIYGCRAKRQRHPGLRPRDGAIGDLLTPAMATGRPLRAPLQAMRRRPDPHRPHRRRPIRRRHAAPPAAARLAATPTVPD